MTFDGGIELAGIHRPRLHDAHRPFRSGRGQGRGRTVEAQHQQADHQQMQGHGQPEGQRMGAQLVQQPVLHAHSSGGSVIRPTLATPACCRITIASTTRP